MKIRGEKFNMIRGFAEVAYSKESIEYMNQQLDKLETEYLNLFTGNTVKHQLKYNFIYYPSGNDNNMFTPLFRFSAKEGLIDTTNTHGDNVYLSIQRSGTPKLLPILKKQRLMQSRKNMAIITAFLNMQRFHGMQ